MFRVTTFGESHGPGVGVVIDGCPPRLPITAEEIQGELDRRRPGQSAITTQRREADAVEILSGVHEGLTTGTPIALLVRNPDQRSGDYDEMRTKFRPSHADYTYQAKYGVRAWEGGGRASARETIGRVAAGVLARKALAAAGAIDIVAWVQRVQDLEVEVDSATVTRAAVDANIVRCPDAATAAKMIARIDEARKAGDSLGGVVEAVARGVPPGLGEPVFDKLDADLAKAMLSLPAAKGFEIGSGFAGTLPHRQPAQRSVSTRTRDGRRASPTRPRSGRARNRSGGVQGGISNGEEIVIRVAFKPTATILREQETVDVQRAGHDDQGARPPRSLRAAARGADRRGDDGAGAGRSFPAPARPVRLRIAPAIALALVALAGAGCRGRAADLLSTFDAAMPPPPPPPNQDPHEVHFTYTAPDAVTFDWRGEGTTLRYWAKGRPPRTVTAHPPTPTPTSLPGPFQEAVADQLLPGTEYQYEVGRPLKPTPHAFRAPPAPGGAGFVFAAVGDIGDDGGQPAAAGIHRDISLAEPLFVLALGDLSYADLRSPSAVDRHFDDVMVWSQRAAYMPAWGNHEWDDPQRDDLRNYKGRFALPHAAASPGAPAAGCCGEDWWWSDIGEVRFIVYPEPYTHDTWADWARRAEPLFADAEADPRLKFVLTAGHRPAYSSGRHGGDPQLRAILDGFGKRFKKYVLNLNGHNHVYERTKPQNHVAEAAHGGTLFLDEVAELPPAVQAKLLRALEQKRITRLGDVREREVDLRIVAATNRPLEDEVKAGRFRQDLFFRLGAATVVLPPLRDRPREIPLLAHRFLAEACGRAGREPPSLSVGAMRRLTAYAWPGNVRELRNTMEYVVATVTEPVIDAWHLPERVAADDVEVAAPDPRAPAPAAGRNFRPLADEVRELERLRMEQALDAADGVQVRAAALIGVPIRTFAMKQKQHGIVPRGRRGA